MDEASTRARGSLELECGLARLSGKPRAEVRVAAGASSRADVWRRLRRRSRGCAHAGSVVLPGGMSGAGAGGISCAVASRGRGQNAAASHRVPLGLLLLSRQQLTAAQLRTALEAQRAAGQGKIGEWLRQLGFVTELQVTAALARQWSCPVLITGPGELGASRLSCRFRHCCSSPFR